VKLVDSSAWVEFVSGGPLAERLAPHFERPAALLTSPIVLYEVYRRLKRDRGEEGALLVVSQIRKGRVEDVSEVVALTAADLAAEHGLAMADALIYATARLHDALLVTCDRDLAELPGVEYHAKS
jgi:predicted nucleic acid-binding protein